MFIITADWDNNAPHLDAKARADLWAAIPAYQKDARSKGIPQLGAGVIYPIPDTDILVDAFKIPDFWPRGFGLDIGWNKVAAIWDAMDPDTLDNEGGPTIYRYDEHYAGEQHPSIHAEAIRRRGLWIPGVIDPAARGRTQDDGKKLLTIWRAAIYGTEDISLGVQMLGIANNAVESGISLEYTAMTTGRLKVFKHRCPNWMAERRLYRRDEHGRIVKKNDHALDAGRYRTASGTGYLKAKPVTAREDPLSAFMSGHRGTGNNGQMPGLENI